MTASEYKELRKAVEEFKSLECPNSCKKDKIQQLLFSKKCLPKKVKEKETIKSKIRDGNCQEINKYKTCLAKEAKSLKDQAKIDFRKKFIRPTEEYAKRFPKCKTTFGRSFGMGEKDRARVALEALRDSI